MRNNKIEKVNIEVSKEIGKVETTCNQCKRKNQQSEWLHNFPHVKLAIPLKFFKASVDCAGLFNTIRGRNRNHLKHYLCSLKYLISRTIQIEMMDGLDTDSFLKASAKKTHRNKYSSDNNVWFL